VNAEISEKLICGALCLDSVDRRQSDCGVNPPQNVEPLTSAPLLKEQPLSAHVVAPPRHGTIEFHNDGSFVYRPLDGVHGTDSFTYRATDGNTWSREALVLVEILPPGTPQGAITSWIAGDANRDRRLDLNDVAFVLGHQFTRLGMAAYDPAADINGDGRVSVKDAVAIRNLLGENQIIASVPAAATVRIDLAIRASALDEAIAQWPAARASARRPRMATGSTSVWRQDSEAICGPALRATRKLRQATASATTAFVAFNQRDE
jgi:hypothetical protein